MFHAGTTDNVIPDTAELRGTIRTLSSALQQKLQRDVRLACEALASAYGAQVDVEFSSITRRRSTRRPRRRCAKR